MKLVVNKTITISLILVLTVAALMTSIVPVNSQEDRSELLQYEWPSSKGGNMDLGWRVGSGPAPATEDIAWTSDLGYPLAAFNGLLFLSGGKVVDPFTGELIYSGAFGTPTKIDDYYFFSDNSVYSTATGNIVYGPYDVSIGIYDSELGMFFTKKSGGGGIFYSTALEGWNWPDISQPPTLAWTTDILKGIPFGDLVVGNGKVLSGTLECSAIGLDAVTGNILWETPIKGYLNYDGSYYDGKWIHGSQQGPMYCFDVDTGNILWEFDPGTFFSFWAYMGAIYDGKIYSINTDNRVYAIDIETGKPVWTWETTEGGVGYQTYTIAGDNKVYAYTGRSDYTDADTGEPYNEEYVCLDAQTGEVLWKTSETLGSTRQFGGPPAIYNILAYGNLYLGDARSTTTAYGPPKTSEPWSNFQANPQHTGDGSRGGPAALKLKWIFDSDSAIFASPTVALNKVYFGSTAGTFYALDHLSGGKVWQFSTGGAIKSNSAYENGKVFFVSDDGNIYCLDANDGSEVWKTHIGANAEYFYHTVQKETSSPVVFDGRVYVGSRNFKIYCLNAATGSIIWSFDAGGLISNVPAVKDGAVYVSSGGNVSRTHQNSGGDSATLYKLDASSGSVIWQSDFPYSRYEGGGQLVGRHLFGSPTVGDGVVYQSSNAWLVFAIDASTGNHLWTFNSTLMSHSVTSALPNDITNVYANGKLYVQDFFRIACLDASTGEKLWDQWLGHNWHGGPIYADGKIYVASDVKSLYVLNAETGQKLDNYGWPDFCWSSGAIYDNKLYWGTLGMKFYCFEEDSRGNLVTYEIQEPGQPPTPSTDTYIIGSAITVIAAIAIGAFLLIRRKKNKK